MPLLLFIRNKEHKKAAIVYDSRFRKVNFLPITPVAINIEDLQLNDFGMDVRKMMI